MTQDSLLHLIYSELRDTHASQVFSYFGNCASLAGLIISIIVLVIAKDVRSFYYRYDRIPKLREGIKNSRARIGDLLSQPEIAELLLKEQLSICFSNLRSVRGKLPRKLRDEIKKTLPLLEKLRGAPTLSKSDLQGVYSGLLVIETDISNYLSDMGSEGIK